MLLPTDNNGGRAKDLDGAMNIMPVRNGAFFLSENLIGKGR